ncbi:hypothetical protein J7L02_00255 [Candidatus Woesearchaeota archaeon]|nr:hypothetical protein [Candidatus Woesearchaeota archaeon]
MQSLPEIFKNWGIDKNAILALNSNRDPFVLKSMGIDIEEVKSQAELVQEQKTHSLEMAQIRSIEANITKLGFKLKQVNEVLNRKIVFLQTENNRLVTELNDLKIKYNTLAQELENLKKSKQSHAHHVTSHKRVLDKPVDRNGVAPSEVSLEKYFNFSHKRF